MSYIMNTIDIASLNTNRRENAESRKRFENRYTYNLHVKHTREQLERMVVPRGITLTIHPFDINEQRQVEGTLITLSATNQNPNILCQREKDELDNYISTRLDVMNDKPYELSQHEQPIKLETKIFNEAVANRAFNIYEKEGETYGEV
jgi:hypothetical protein